MYFNTGYDTATLQTLSFQLNGYNKFELKQNGEVVIGADQQATSVWTSYPSVLRGPQPGTFATDTIGGNLTIQGGRGTGTGVPGDVIIKTGTAGSTGTTYSTMSNRVEVKSNTGQVKFNNYTSSTSFTGTATALLAVDSSGNIITRATTTGSSGTSGANGANGSSGTSGATGGTGSSGTSGSSGQGTISGSTNNIAKFTGTTTIGNSIATDNGSTFAVSGAITATGDVTAFSSDERLKENIVNIPNALDKILSLNGVTYDWNEKALAFGFVPDNRRHDVGLIAQQVEAVLPEAIAPAPFDTDVDTGKSISGDNYLTVRYDKLVALLIEGVKEQQAQIDELKKLLNK
jgi:hypothetical protein